MLQNGLKIPRMCVFSTVKIWHQYYMKFDCFYFFSELTMSDLLVWIPSWDVILHQLLQSFFECFLIFQGAPAAYMKQGQPGSVYYRTCPLHLASWRSQLVWLSVVSIVVAALWCRTCSSSMQLKWFSNYFFTLPNYFLQTSEKQWLHARKKRICN